MVETFKSYGVPVVAKKKIRRMKTVVIAIFCCVVASSAHAQSTYFVDAISGSDSNEGTTERAAIRSLEKVNQVALQAGDSLLFRRGGRWIGTLRPKGSGTAGKRIVIGAYA